MDLKTDQGRLDTAPTLDFADSDDTDWRARLAEQHAEWRRRRDELAAIRAEQAARRTAGKRILHGRRRSRR